MWSRCLTINSPTSILTTYKGLVTTGPTKGQAKSFGLCRGFDGFRDYILHFDALSRTQMTIVLLEKGLALEGWPSKIEVIWALDIYIYTYMFLNASSLSQELRHYRKFPLLLFTLPSTKTITKHVMYRKWRNPHLSKLYGYGLWIRENPPPKQL